MFCIVFKIRYSRIKEPANINLVKLITNYSKEYLDNSYLLINLIDFMSLYDELQKNNISNAKPDD